MEAAAVGMAVLKFDNDYVEYIGGTESECFSFINTSYDKVISSNKIPLKHELKNLIVSIIHEF